MTGPQKRYRKLGQSIFPPGKSLRGRLGMVVSSSFLAMILLTTVTVFLFTYRAELDAWRGRQGEVARAGADRVNVFIERVNTSLMMLSMFNPGEFQNGHSIDESFLEINPSILELVILDESGETQYILSKSESVLNNSFTILQSQWFQIARDGNTYLGTFQISPLGEPYMILARPLADNYVVVARISMEELWRVVREINFGETGMAYVINSDGLIISHPQQEVVNAIRSVSNEPIFAEILTAGDEGWYGAAVDLDGKPVVSASIPVGETGWVLITEMQQSEAYINSRNALILTGGGMVLLAFVIMTILKVLINRMVVDPVDKLRTGAERIGEGDLEYRFKNPGKDELSQVMQAFNQMTLRLSEQRNSLDQRKMEFEALFEVGLSLITQQSLKSVLDTVAASVVKFIRDVDSVSIYTYENDVLSFYASSWTDGRKDIAASSPGLEEAIGRCAENGLLIRWVETTLVKADEVSGSFVCIPLMIGSAVVGVMSVNLRRLTEVSDAELSPLLLLGDQAAIALENARLHENEQHEIRERKQAQQQLIELNAELEARVLARTEELSSLNVDLRHEIIERKAAMEQVNASLKEKEVLLKEIHHRVKNNLQIVSSLLNLQASRLDDPEVLGILRESQNRVRSMALLHEKLYQSDNLAEVAFDEYIQSLISYLLGVYRNSSGQVEVHLDVDPVKLDIDTAVPCGLILNELVSNALKHAFPSGTSGDLYVVFKMQTDRELSLRVADNGVGFPPGVDVFNKQTLGLQLISSLVDQLDGSYSVNGTGGAEFLITLRRSPVYTFEK